MGSREGDQLIGRMFWVVLAVWVISSHSKIWGMPATVAQDCCWSCRWGLDAFPETPRGTIHLPADQLAGSWRYRLTGPEPVLKFHAGRDPVAKGTSPSPAVPMAVALSSSATSGKTADSGCICLVMWTSDQVTASIDP